MKTVSLLWGKTVLIEEIRKKRQLLFDYDKEEQSSIDSSVTKLKLGMNVLYYGYSFYR
jgi:hypothetical protein